LFENAQKQRYAMIVNHNVDEAVDVPVRLADDIERIWRISEATGLVEALSLDGREVAVRLDPGSGALLRLE
jgi:hypothetical protein